MNLRDSITEAIKALPSTATFCLTVLFGITLEQWASIAAICFIVLQAFFLLKEKWWDKRKDK